tara:strand:- start:34 stop:453 length:420 start_codon:yes stop_codon:yes gene_type:complete
MINNKNLYRILIAQDGSCLVNMIYAEIEGEVFGAFSGNGGGGLFYFNEDHESTVSDDLYEFDSSYERLEETCTELERLRSEFEEYDDAGNIIGISEIGQEFLSQYGSNDDGYIVAFSDDASEDYIYDIQDEWNLKFNLD